LNILDKIITYINENPPGINSNGQFTFVSIPDDVIYYLQFFNTNFEGLFFKSENYDPNFNKLLSLIEAQQGYWNDDQWVPFLSFYLDQRIGENHFLRNRSGSEYLPVQQIFEEYISSIKGDVLNDFNKSYGVRYHKSRLGQLIHQFLESNDIAILESTFYEKLLKGVYKGELIFDDYLSIEKLKNALFSDEKKTNVFFGNAQNSIFDNVNRYTVQSFLNEVYLNISNQVRSYSYGKEWLLFNLINNDLITESEINRRSHLSQSQFAEGVFIVLIKNNDLDHYTVELREI
jgi:hypothetical protein